MWFRHGLKAQKLLAQGNTLGISAKLIFSHENTKEKAQKLA